jgi:hypothetical protein
MVPRGNVGLIIGSIFITVALLTLIARLYTRLYLVKNAGAEETVIVFAWVGLTTKLTEHYVASVIFGFGKRKPIMQL